MLWLELVKKYWKLILGAVLALSLMGGSFYYGRQSVKPVMQTVVQEKIVEKVVEKIVEVEKKHTDTAKDTTTTIVKNKDGSETTTINEHEHTKIDDNTKKTDNKVDNKVVEKKTETKPVALTHYRLGGFIETHPWDLFDSTPMEKPSYGISASTRLVSSVWLDTTYNFKEKTATLGLSWEF